VVERKNILVVPADCAAAREVIAALRYEKSAQLVLLPQNRGLGSVPGAISLSPMLEPDADALAAQLKGSIDAAFVFDDSWRACLTALGVPVLGDGAAAPAAAEDRAHACYTTQSGKTIYCASVAFTDVGQGRHSPAAPDVLARVQAAAQQRGLRGAWCFAPGTDTEVSPLSHEALALHRLFGVNLLALSLFETGGHPVDVIPPLGHRVHAMAQGLSIELDKEGPVFLDLDDTLLVHGAVHDDGRGFLARAQGRGLPVHLVTRHFQEPVKTLAAHGIDARQFADIHWLTDGTPKSAVIAGAGGALFIDDSFKERREVRDALGIPVFAPDVLAHLLR